MNENEAALFRKNFADRSKTAKSRQERNAFLNIIKFAPGYYDARSIKWDERRKYIQARDELKAIGEAGRPIVPQIIQTGPEIINQESVETQEDIQIPEEILELQTPSRDSYRQHALERIIEYEKAPQEEWLRQHQQDVMTSMRIHLEQGFSSGMIILPTGAGKTRVAGELIRVFGLPTLMFSHTHDILQQNGATIAAMNPHTRVSTFSGDVKDSSGQVINTMYQSFGPLSRRRGVDLHRIGLVIYDEADLSLGRERYKIHGQFPNAIQIALTATPTFGQLRQYKKEGAITGEEEWLETFGRVIHHMSVEEALERRVIPPQDIELVHSGVFIPDINASAGRYEQKALQKFVNTRSRNALVLAMVAGPEFLPADAVISNEARAHLQRIHEKIKGRRTVIHAMNINHILVLENLLKEHRISAHAFYGTMQEDRDEVKAKVRSGEIQVLIGDQLTGRGLDIPELEVGIHASPIISARELIQQMGRLFRQSPDTGKEKGVSIQIVDKHATSRANQPVLLTDLFAPDFVLRSKINTSKRSGGGIDKKKQEPSITIDGTLDLETYFEEVRLADILQNKFKNASLQEASQILTNLYEDILARQEGSISLAMVFSDLVGRLPERISQDLSNKALAAIANGEVQLGIQVVILSNMKSILTALSPYLTDNDDLNNDMIQEVIIRLSSRDLHNRSSLATQIHTNVRSAATRFLATELGMPVNWIEKKIHMALYRDAEKVFTDFAYGLDETALSEQASVLSDKYGISTSGVETYLAARNTLTPLTPTLEVRSPHEEATSHMQLEWLNKRLERLTDREQKVIALRFGHGLTQNEVGIALGGITGGRVRQIEEKALRKLRYNARRITD